MNDEHRLIFPELPRQHWKRLVMNSGLDVEVQLTGLHYPLTRNAMDFWLLWYI
jgi:hypothetical protein